MSDTPPEIEVRAPPRIWPWFLAAFAATALFLNPWTSRYLPSLPIRPRWLGAYLLLTAINLALAAIMGMLTRLSIVRRLLVVLLAVLLPLLFYMFMLFIGCAMLNTTAGHYVCGL
jgi:hypothetical protein